MVDLQLHVNVEVLLKLFLLTRKEDYLKTSGKVSCCLNHEFHVQEI